MIENPGTPNNPPNPRDRERSADAPPSAGVAAASASFEASSLAGRVAGTTALLGILVLVGKGTGLLRELVIARGYGAGAEFDAYLIALTVPEILAAVALYVTVNLFLPIYMTQRETSPEGADRLASVFWGRAVLVLIGVSVVLGGLAPVIVRILAPALDPRLFGITVYSLRLLALIVLFRGMQGILRGLVNAHRRFVVPTVGAMLVSLVVIGFVLVGAPRWGVRALVWGVVAGSTVPALVILPTAARAIPRLFRDVAATHPAMREVSRVLPWVLAVEIASLVLPLVDRTVATRFLPPGRISALSYALVLNNVPMDLVALPLAMILFPEFAALHARRDRERFQRVLRRGVRATVTVVLPVAVLLIVLRAPVIRAVYERGAFDSGATDLTASALWAYAVGLPFQTVAALAAQAAYAARMLRRLVLVKGIALVAKVGVTLLLVDRLGHAGIALGTGAFFATLAVLLLPALAGGWRGLVPRPPVLAGATAIAVGAGWGMTRGLIRAGIERGPVALAAMVGVLGVSCLVYLGICRLGRVEEVLWLESLVRARFPVGRARRG